MASMSSNLPVEIRLQGAPSQKEASGGVSVPSGRKSPAEGQPEMAPHFQAQSSPGACTWVEQGRRCWRGKEVPCVDS